MSMPVKPARTEGELAQLEAAYSIYDLYVWLSFRLEDGFPGRMMAMQQRAAVAALVDEALSRLIPDRDQLSRRCHLCGRMSPSECLNMHVFGMS
jgi:ATP-dependent RNA helicase SUPV3L1/SUV3